MKEGLQNPIEADDAEPIGSGDDQREQFKSLEGLVCG